MLQAVVFNDERSPFQRIKPFALRCSVGVDLLFHVDSIVGFHREHRRDDSDDAQWVSHGIGKRR